MLEHESVPLQSWLELLCGMIPGIRQAILLTDSFAKADQFIQWPKDSVIHSDVIEAANLAVSQKKKVTTTLSVKQGNDASEDMVIAIPLTGPANFIGTLAVRVSVKPSQQTVVIQILQWGESWLQLLLQQEESRQPLSHSKHALPRSNRGISILQSSRSRLVLAGMVLLVAAMSLISGTYRVTSPASLEGSIQRVIVAPFDGYIAKAFARAGETVAAGDVIAELDSLELLLQQQRYQAEKNEYTREYRQALAAREKAQAHIFKSQVSQAEAQLKLLAKKIQRSKLVAPLDGVIITGDLSRSLGAPVDTGDILFEVAPLDEYRLVIFVDEKQVVDVRQGLRGALSLKALPAAELAFVVQKVSPVFEENAKGIAYRVEAKLEENNPALRPGMQGVAKIDIDQRSYLWIYLHELYDAIRLWLWSWRP